MPPSPTEESSGSPTGSRAQDSARGKKQWIALICVLAAAGGIGWLNLQPGADKEPELGEVTVLEPVQLNLAAGRYLRIGLALQLAEGVKEVDGSRALDATITRFSGLPLTALDEAKERDQLKAELTDELMRLYPDEVLDSYFVEFVTQ